MVHPRTYREACLYTYMISRFSTHAHTCTHTRTHMQRGLVYMKINVYEHGYIIRKRLRNTVSCPAEFTRGPAALKPALKS